MPTIQAYDLGILNYGAPASGVNVTHPFLGRIVLQKTGGTASGLPVGTLIVIPSARISPSNPLNNSYPGVINSTSYPSQKVCGKRTPSVALTANVKASWINSVLLQSLLLNTDGQGQTDRFSILLDDNYNPRTYDWCRCAHFSLYQTSQGGPIMCEIGFVARFGDSELHYLAGLAGGTTINMPSGEVLIDSAPLASYTPTVPDAGYLDDVSVVDFGSVPTMSLVRSWRLNILRGQGHVPFMDQVPWMADVASGMLGGTLMIEQSPVAAAVVPGTAATIRLHINRLGASSGPKALSISMLLSQDTQQLDQDISMGNMVRTFTLIDLAAGGNPISCTDV
jgi:hypothetical protein